MIAQLPLLAIVFTLILSVRSVFFEPAAFFDPQAKMLTTINRFGVERCWPRYRGEGELAAETGRILLLDDRGRKRVVLTRFEVNPAQFELVRNAIVAVEGVGKAGEGISPVQQ